MILKLKFFSATLLLFFISYSILLSQENLYLEEDVNFGRLSATAFKYSVSSCVSKEFCGINLFDSNEKTEWISDSESLHEWVIIDFKSKRLINGISIDVENMIPFEYYVQVLKRDTWTTIFDNQYPEKQNRHTLGNIDASILRIFFIKKLKKHLQISNIRIYLNNNNLTGIDRRLTGYKFPIDGGLIPTEDYSLPGAPRKYRNGTHKGLDISTRKNFFGNIVYLTKDTRALATFDGTIVRADINYSPMMEQEFKEISEYNQTHPVTFVDKDFGGRQVWIDHGNGVMTSYNHLSSIDSGIRIGEKVKKGDVIGKVGNSGLMGEAKNNNEGVHLHLEIWIDGEFLGNDMSLQSMRRFLSLFFNE